MLGKFGFFRIWKEKQKQIEKPRNCVREFQKGVREVEKGKRKGRPKKKCRKRKEVTNFQKQ